MLRYLVLLSFYFGTIMLCALFPEKRFLLRVSNLNGKMKQTRMAVDGYFQQLLPAVGGQPPSFGVKLFMLL